MDVLDWAPLFCFEIGPAGSSKGHFSPVSVHGVSGIRIYKDVRRTGNPWTVFLRVPTGCRGQLRGGRRPSAIAQAGRRPKSASCSGFGEFLNRSRFKCRDSSRILLGQCSEPRRKEPKCHTRMETDPALILPIWMAAPSLNGWARSPSVFE